MIYLTPAQVLLFCLGILLCFSVHSQRYFGLKAGINYTMPDDYLSQEDFPRDELLDSEAKFGYQLGFFIINKRNDRFSWQHQLYWNKRDFYLDFTRDRQGNPGRTQVDLGAVFLNYSLMAQWHVQGKPDLFINFGPYAGGLMISTAKGTRIADTNSGTSETFDGDGQHYFGALDAGIKFGIGTLFKISEHDRLLIEFTDSFSPWSVTGNYEPVQLNTYLLTIGYVFNTSGEE